MASQGLNFLWLNLDLPAPPDPEDGSIREPLPLKYIDSIRKAGAENPGTAVNLWVDSKRLTKRQIKFLQGALEEDRPNVHLKDLRSISIYRHNALYNQPETNPNWRSGGQSSLIWRQVDAAKILISLQGNYDQTFFCDLDHARLPINGDKIQEMLKKHQFMVGSGASYSTTSIENQLWGFERGRKPFFESYYATALATAAKGDNAWSDLCSKVRSELHYKEGIRLQEICFPFGNDGSQAEHTGHEWRNGDKNSKSAPATIPQEEIARVFNAKSKHGKIGKPAVLTAAAPFNVVAATANDNAPLAAAVNDSAPAAVKDAAPAPSTAPRQEARPFMQATKQANAPAFVAAPA